MSAYRPRDIEKLRDRTDRLDPDGCWEWRGTRDKDGYGMLHVGSRSDGTSRSVRTSRMALEVSLGRPIRDGMVAAHKCDNPPCNRPSHMVEATQRANIEMATTRGRRATGNRHPMAKWDSETIKAIRRLHGSGVRSSDLCRRFGMSKSNMSRVTRGAIWTDIG